MSLEAFLKDKKEQIDALREAVEERKRTPSVWAPSFSQALKHRYEGTVEPPEPEPPMPSELLLDSNLSPEALILLDSFWLEIKKLRRELDSVRGTVFAGPER